VNVTRIDLHPLAFILQFLNQFGIASRLTSKNNTKKREYYNRRYPSWGQRAGKSTVINGTETCGHDVYTKTRIINQEYTESTEGGSGEVLQNSPSERNNMKTSMESSNVFIDIIQFMKEMKEEMKEEMKKLKDKFKTIWRKKWKIRKNRKTVKWTRWGGCGCQLRRKLERDTGHRFGDKSGRNGDNSGVTGTPF
jgi:hypothetical protein